MRDAQPDPSDPHANANQQVGPTCIHVHAQVESEVVTVEFDNRGCDCEWKLYWVNPTGDRLQYVMVSEPFAVFLFLFSHLERA